MRFFSPKITFAVKVSDGSNDEAGAARASKSMCVCVCVWGWTWGSDWGKNKNGKNILCFGVLGVVHGEMSGEEISFYPPSPRGPAVKLGKEEHSPLYSKCDPWDLLHQLGVS